MADFNFNNTIALYARVSSDQQAEAGTINSQIEELKKKITEAGYTITENHYYIDDGYSGTTLIRPGLEKLRDNIAAGLIEKIYVHSPDRLARNYAYQVLLLEEFNKNGVEVVFLNHKIGKSPEEKLLLQVQGIVAEYERAKIMERSRRGKLHAAHKGSVNVLGKAPYGYNYVSCNITGGEASYEIKLDEAKVVRKIFEWVAYEKCSLYQVARRLENEKIVTRNGKNNWRRTTIRKMIMNPAYKGKAAFGKTRACEYRPKLRPYKGNPERPKKGYSTIDVPEEKWIYIPVPAIINEELYEMAHEQLAENRKRYRIRKEGPKYLLQGLTVCKECGYAFYGSKYKRKSKKAKGDYLMYYKCSGGDGSSFGGKRICWNKSIRVEQLNNLVWNDIVSLLSDPDRIEQEYKRRIEDNNDEIDINNKNLINEMKRIKTSTDKLIDAYSDGLLTKEEFEPRIKKNKKRLKSIEDELNKEKNRKEEVKAFRVIIGQIKEFKDMVLENLKKADWETKRKIIISLVKKIEIGKENLHIVYRIRENFQKKIGKKNNLRNCILRAVS